MTGGSDKPNQNHYAKTSLFLGTILIWKHKTAMLYTILHQFLSIFIVLLFLFENFGYQCTLSISIFQHFYFFYLQFFHYWENNFYFGLRVNDLVHPNTSTFSTHDLILVHFKSLHWFSQTNFISFSHLNCAWHNLVVYLCRALKILQQYFTVL